MKIIRRSCFFSSSSSEGERKMCGIGNPEKALTSASTSMLVPSVKVRVLTFTQDSSTDAMVFPTKVEKLMILI